MTTTTLAPAPPVATDADLDQAQTTHGAGGPSRGLWRLQMLFLALGLVIDFVAFSAALQLLDSQMVQWQAWLIAGCAGALALFLMFEAGHLESQRRKHTKGRHGRWLIRVLMFVWMLAGLAATYIRVTTPPGGSEGGAFGSAAATTGWDLGLFTIYPEALPMALFMFVLYLGVGISAYIAGLKFEEHRRPDGEQRTRWWQRAWRSLTRPAWLARRRHRKAVRAASAAVDVEESNLERLQVERDQAKERLAHLESAEEARKAQVQEATNQLATAKEQLEALLRLQAALDLLEKARALRLQRLEDKVATQQHSATLITQLKGLDEQIELEKRAAQERGRTATEQARLDLSRGLGEPASTVMGTEAHDDTTRTDDPRNDR